VEPKGDEPRGTRESTPCRTLRPGRGRVQSSTVSNKLPRGGPLFRVVSLSRAVPVLNHVPPIGVAGRRHTQHGCPYAKGVPRSHPTKNKNAHNSITAVYGKTDTGGRLLLCSRCQLPQEVPSHSVSTRRQRSCRGRVLPSLCPIITRDRAKAQKACSNIACFPVRDPLDPEPDRIPRGTNHPRRACTALGTLSAPRSCITHSE